MIREGFIVATSASCSFITAGINPLDLPFWNSVVFSSLCGVMIAAALYAVMVLDCTTYDEEEEEY